jgi:hypothetical protein
VRDRDRSVITVTGLRTGLYESSEFDFRQEQKIASTLFWWTFHLVDVTGLLPGCETDHSHLSMTELRKSELSLQFSKRCPDLAFASSRGQTYLYIGCPTTYQTRHFFNNSKTKEDIPTKQTHTTDTFLFISHTTNVLPFKSRCNIFIGFRIIKEMPGLVGNGTPCIYFHMGLEYIYVRSQYVH